MLCKGDILEAHIKERRAEEGVEYDFVVFCGDGTADLCAVLRGAIQWKLFQLDFALEKWLKIPLKMRNGVTCNKSKLSLKPFFRLNLKL